MFVLGCCNSDEHSQRTPILICGEFPIAFDGDRGDMQVSGRAV